MGAEDLKKLILNFWVFLMVLKINFSANEADELYRHTTEHSVLVEREAESGEVAFCCSQRQQRFHSVCIVDLP